MVDKYFIIDKFFELLKNTIPNANVVMFDDIIYVVYNHEQLQFKIIIE